MIKSHGENEIEYTLNSNSFFSHNDDNDKKIRLT